MPIPAAALPILKKLWDNKEEIAKYIGIALIAFLAYWFFWHNPQKIKALEATIAEQAEQITRRDNALELQGVIRKEHERITREENENLRRIRTDPPPPRTGYLILPGLLPDLYSDDTADRAKAGNAGS